MYGWVLYQWRREVLGAVVVVMVWNSTPSNQVPVGWVCSWVASALCREGETACNFPLSLLSVTAVYGNRWLEALPVLEVNHQPFGFPDVELKVIPATPSYKSSWLVPCIPPMTDAVVLSSDLRLSMSWTLRWKEEQSCQLITTWWLVGSNDARQTR